MILEREPATEFEEIGTVQFVATFKRKNYETPTEDFPGTAARKTTRKASEKTSEKTSEKILAAIKADTTLSARQLSEMLGLSPRAIEFQISQLRKKGILMRIGPDKGGYWAIVKP